MPGIDRRMWIGWMGALGVGGLAARCGMRPSWGQSSGQWDAVVRRSPWVFLGDSNTYAGRYVAEIDGRLRSSLGDGAPKVLNLGMSSETASGLSEADHPFRRPWVHARLDKVLRMTRPGVVFICYGMNDGIYGPPDQAVMEAYRKGMLRLAEAVHAAGAVLICLTPPPFEPEPLAERGKLGPSAQGRYAYFAPYPDYDVVLEQQTQWCLANAMQASVVVDVHHLLHAARRSHQQRDPEFCFTRDGVHFGSAAHHEIAVETLRALGAPAGLVQTPISDESLAVAIRRMQVLRDAYLSATGKNRPGLPAGLPVWLAERRAAALK